MQINCIADVDDADTADDLAAIIVYEAKRAEMEYMATEDVTVMGVEVVAKRSAEEPGTDWERFDLDLLVQIREDNA